MKRLILATALLALVACAGQSGAPVPTNTTYANSIGDHSTVDECPRADGEPCR